MNAKRTTLEHLKRIRGSETAADRSPSNRIERTPNVCGGDARIAGTRIPVWVLEQYRRLGQTEADILVSYPSLQAADLVAAWAYVDAHPDEIDWLIQQNDEDEAVLPSNAAKGH